MTVKMEWLRDFSTLETDLYFNGNKKTGGKDIRFTDFDFLERQGQKTRFPKQTNCCKSSLTVEYIDG